MTEYYKLMKQVSADVWGIFKEFQYNEIKSTEYKDEYFTKLMHKADEVITKYQGTEAEIYAQDYTFKMMDELSRHVANVDSKSI